MLSNFFKSHEGFIFRYYAIFPVIVLLAFSMGRGLGNTVFYISLLLFIGGLSFFKQNFYLLRGAAIAYFLWIASIFSIFFINGSVDNKTLLIFFFSSFFGLMLSSFSFISFDFFSKWSSRLVFFLMLYELLFILNYYVVDGSSPASNIEIWNFVILSPLLFLGAYSRSIKILLGFIVLLIVFLSASRTEMLAVLLAFVVFFSFVYKKMIYVFLALPFVIVFSILSNQLFRSKLSFENLEVFLSRITSRRSDIWFEVFEKNSAIWFGNGLGSNVDLTSIHGISSMHNVFIELYWDFGLLSVFAFVALLAYFLIKVCGIYNSDDFALKTKLGVFVSAFVICFSMMMLDKSFTNFVPRFYFYFVLGMIFIISTAVSGIENKKSSQHLFSQK